jgi:immunoglobulin-binding protein 1
MDDDTLLERFQRAIALLSQDDDVSLTPDEIISSKAIAAVAAAGGGGGDHHHDDGLHRSSTQPNGVIGRPVVAAVRAVSMLEDLQRHVAERAVFSSNEPLREISTASLPLLALEHHLARGWTQVPWSSSMSSVPSTPPPQSAARAAPASGGGAGVAPTMDPASRRAHLLRACDLWIGFVRRLEGLEVLSPSERRQLDDFEEALSGYRGGDDSSLEDDLEGRASNRLLPPPSMSRDEKIARFRARQELAQQQKRLKSLRERRSRIGAKDDDEIDGYDGDGLARSLAMTALHMAKADALEELDAAIRELPMVGMMIHAQQQQQQPGRHASDPHWRYTRSAGDDARTLPSPMGDPRARQQPLQVTRVSKDAFGQLQVKREEIRSGVLRPGWNQPTMSLEELAEREVRDALEREERQRSAEAEARGGPRRYDQLEKDGAEDDADLVDASAALDRKWDDWKDENPRGSGNKRGNVGDRNF